MKAKIIKIDDETAVILPREIVRMLDLKEGQELHAPRLVDGGFRLGENDPEHDRAMRIAEEAMERYAETFKALAKS